MSTSLCRLRDEGGLHEPPHDCRPYGGFIARPPRIEVAGGTFHVTARGNRRQSIYHDDDNRTVFLTMRNRVLQRFGWDTTAYCLMTNHFHLPVETPSPNLSAGMHYLNGSYARYFNERYSVEGHLFERRFWSRLIKTEADLVGVLDYIAFNPVRAGLCERPSQWRWSSFYGVVDARFES